MKKNPQGLPTEIIELPSKGLIYPSDSPLSSGTVEVMYPTAKSEDILSNINYMQKGVAVDKFMESLIVSDIKLEDLIPGDADALMVSLRVLGLGKEYVTKSKSAHPTSDVRFDLTTMKEKGVDFTKFEKGLNSFDFTLKKGLTVKYKLITGKDQKDMLAEVEGMKKLNKDYSADTSLFLKYSIIQVGDKVDRDSIRKFVDELLMIDSRELQADITKTTPGLVWKGTGIIVDTKEVKEGLFIPYTGDFFWPSK